MTILGTGALHALSASPHSIGYRPDELELTGSAVFFSLLAFRSLQHQLLYFLFYSSSDARGYGPLHPLPRPFLFSLVVPLFPQLTISLQPLPNPTSKRMRAPGPLLHLLCRDIPPSTSTRSMWWPHLTISGTLATVLLEVADVLTLLRKCFTVRWGVDTDKGLLFPPAPRPAPLRSALSKASATSA